MDKLEGTILADYDTIYFDLDKTLWECYTSQGTSIGAYDMTPPFELKTGVMIKDIEGNFCKLQDGIRTILRLLDERNTNMGTLSSGEAENVTSGAQPSVLLLKKFDLYGYFNMGVVCKRGIDKREYALPFGKTLLIDDDDENLDSVKENELVDILDRKAFEDWDQLLQKKTSNLVLGLYSFLTKRAQKEFEFRSGASILLDLYKAELDYTPAKRKQGGEEEVSDEENVRFLQSKSNIPRLFEEAVQYLRNMLNDTIEYSSKRSDYITDSQLVITTFSEALRVLNETSKYIYNADHWPQVFIVIDNVINLMHTDMTFIEHILLSDESTLSKSYEEHIGAEAITFEDKDDFGYYLNKLQEEWNEFKDFLIQQGKSLQFTSESSKLSWQEHLDPEKIYNGDIEMPDLFWEDIPDKVRWYCEGRGISYREMPEAIKTSFDTALLKWEARWEKEKKKLSWQTQPEGMTEEQFWQIMGASDTPANVRKRLRMLTPEQLIVYQDMFNILFTKMLPVVQDEWMEASSDSLDYSIFNVIYSGKDDYYYVLAHPRYINNVGEYEEVSYFAGEIYEEKTGDDKAFWDGIKPYGSLKLGWQIQPEEQNPNLSFQYDLIKKAIEKLDFLDFGEQDLVQDAIYEAKEYFEMIGSNYNLKNLNQTMNLLDRVYQMCGIPSFPTTEETRNLSKAQTIIDTLMDKL